MRANFFILTAGIIRMKTSLQLQKAKFPWKKNIFRFLATARQEIEKVINNRPE